MSIDYLQPLFDWLKTSPEIAYFVIFLLSLSESLVIVGLIVPGIAIMTIIGTFIGTGYLNFWPTFIVSVLGAIVGDGISYWIGKNFQSHIRGWWFFTKYPELLIRCENFFKRHGGKSVVFGRFVGPVRPMIPAVAGMMSMPTSYFYTVNIISAFLWAPVYLFPGVIFGTTLAQLPSEVSTKVISLLIVLLLSIWLLAKVIKYFFYAIKIEMRRLGNKIFIYAENNSMQVLQKIVRHPLTHKKQQADSFLFLIILLIITTLFVIGVKSRIVVTGLNPFFKHLSLLFTSNNDFYNNLMLIAYSNCNITVILLIFIFILLYFAVKIFIVKSHASKTINNTWLLLRTFALTCLLILSFFIINYGISNLISYPSPFEQNTNLFLYSFPNLNIGLLTLLLGYISIIKYCNNPIQYKYSSFNLYSISIIIIFSFLSICLGTAWLSDIIGSILMSSCLLLMFCVIYWQYPLENINFSHFYKVCMLFLTILITINSLWLYIALSNKPYVFNANANIVKTSLDFNDWQEQPQSLFIENSDPIINVQWIGDKESIIKTLEKNNWYKQADFNLINVLKLFKTRPNIKEMPLSPKYYLDHNASIQYSKFEPRNKVLSIRLWESEYKINNQNLWIGTIEYLKPQKYFKTLHVLRHWPRAEFANATKELCKDLDKLQLNHKNYLGEHDLIDDQFNILLIF